MVRLLTLALGAGLPAWGGWNLGAEHGIMIGYWLAVIGFASGWYFARKFVREHLD